MIEDPREPPENLIPSSPVDVPPWTCTENGDMLQFWSDGMMVFETVNSPETLENVQAEVEEADAQFAWFWTETRSWWEVRKIPFMSKIQQIRIRERIREEENR